MGSFWNSGRIHQCEFWNRNFTTIQNSANQDAAEMNPCNLPRKITKPFAHRSYVRDGTLHTLSISQLIESRNLFPN